MSVLRHAHAGLLVLSIVVGAGFQRAGAMVVCPRVTSEHTADVSDLQRFRQFSQWRDKTGNDLALAIWQYLCGYETGVYHFFEVLDGVDPFDEYATVRDPLKILNVYNMGYCGIFGPVLDGILQGVGFEQGRSFALEKWNHCATEVWYEGGWHYLDMDVRGALLDAEGIVASLQQAQEDRGLWVSPPRRIEPFFPNDPDKSRVFDIYHGSPVYNQYRWFQGSHTMDFYLRQGESFTRWWTPQGGRWHHLPRYSQTRWVRDLILQEPVGMKPNHREFTRWNHGNGLFHYAPNLSAGSTDFADGARVARNLTPGEQGLHLIETGDAEVVFEVFTPYIIVARINDLDEPNDDAEASVVTLEAARPIDVAVSLDHGLTWQPAGTVQGEQKDGIDLTRFVRGTYGYLLRLSASGVAKQVAIRSLSVDTWVQVAPISLPRLKAGENHMTYEAGDRYGLRTVPMLVNPDTSDPADLKKHLVAMPTDYDPRRDTSRIRGDAILRLAAPAGMKIAWLSVGATFRTYQGGQAGQTDNRIAYAVDEPQDFKEIYRSSVPTWVNHWRYNWDTDVRLEEPAEAVWVKFHGDPGLNTMRACLHLLPKETPSTRVQITHSYTIDGRPQRRTVNLDQPAAYVVQCEGEPNDVSVTISVPSVGDVVTRVPETIRTELNLAPFYQKYLDVDGLPVVGSAQVSDSALREAAWIIRHVLAGRADILCAMADSRVRVAVMAWNEFTTDVPEHSRLEPKTYWDRRARGLGATRRAPAVSCGEENLLCFPGDPYPTENIFIHEFAHTIHSMGLSRVDPTFDQRLKTAYEHAREQGLWPKTYAITNRQEYWAEGVQCWFDNNRENDACHCHVNTRAELEQYDPDLANLCREVFGAGPWRYHKPMDRDPADRAHLAGWNPAGAPRFRWRDAGLPQRDPGE